MNAESTSESNKGKLKESIWTPNRLYEEVLERRLVVDSLMGEISGSCISGLDIFDSLGIMAWSKEHLADRFELST